MEDGPIQVDSVGYEAKSEQYVVSVELHSGRNRIVRRMFEHLGYEVERLDRLEYGGLNKRIYLGAIGGFWQNTKWKNFGELGVKQEISSAKLRCTKQ